MASFTNASNHLLFSSSPHSLDTHHHCSSHFPSLPFLIHPRQRQSQQQHRQQCFSFNLVVSKERSLGSSLLLFQKSSCSGFAKKKTGWQDDGDFALEAEVLEFMQKSEDPSCFPSKKQLVEAGRSDLVERIVKQGGWLSTGWDSDEEDTVQEDGVPVVDEVSEGEGDERVLNDDKEIFGDRNASSLGCSGIETSEASSSGRGMENNDESGIGGILSRLEKQRNVTFGATSRDKRKNDDQDDLHRGTSEKTVKGNNERSRGLSSRICDEDLFDDSGGMFSDFGTEDSIKPDTWRKFSSERARSLEKGFEDKDRDKDRLNSDKREKERNEIGTRLQDLESELASVLCGLPSGGNSPAAHKSKGKSSAERHMISDDWEFQETEIMKSRDKLRSLRAQFAILEGKMALAIIETRKEVEVKQKRILYAQKSLSLLRTACIVWPNSASEVFVVGSFDGWTSQRKMERSSVGIFSLYLKLYPGQYEFKFVVDGLWMIDPLRPVVNHSGYQNNLLIVD